MFLLNERTKCKKRCTLRCLTWYKNNISISLLQREKFTSTLYQKKNIYKSLLTKNKRKYINVRKDVDPHWSQHIHVICSLTHIHVVVTLDLLLAILISVLSTKYIRLWVRLFTAFLQHFSVHCVLWVSYSSEPLVMRPRNYRLSPDVNRRFCFNFPWNLGYTNTSSKLINPQPGGT